GVILAGGEPYRVPLRRENDFLVSLDELPAEVLERAKLLYLNYPNNPTTAVAPRSYLRRAVELCHSFDLVLVNDLAYSELAFDGYRPPSILEVEGAEEVALEFHSFSKTFNMTGWRLGWAAGGADLVRILARVKTFMDTGPFLVVQAAGAAALDAYDEWVPGNVEQFRRRRDAVVEALRGEGFEVEAPKATMYVWIPLPEGETGEEFARRALEEQGVVILPGSALGKGGEGFFRIALTQPEERLREGAARLGRLVES
ncbi:MAG: aminotransferase class I/II-fold pyridoxal phosphate-dependent enzyme, partial [Longimicrobiales bacterium]|nr:aminotransferase class I/II-fold pyridoxal phosphate-dependent enzyme [Longimicrobiales bacterium]